MIIGGAFAIANTKTHPVGGKEGGQKFPPLKPLPFCPPQIRGVVGAKPLHNSPLIIFFKIGSNIVQDVRHSKTSLAKGKFFVLNEAFFVSYRMEKI